MAPKGRDAATSLVPSEPAKVVEMTGPFFATQDRQSCERGQRWLGRWTPVASLIHLSALCSHCCNQDPASSNQRALVNCTDTYMAVTLTHILHPGKHLHPSHRVSRPRRGSRSHQQATPVYFPTPTHAHGGWGNTAIPPKVPIGMASQSKTRSPSYTCPGQGREERRQTLVKEESI